MVEMIPSILLADFACLAEEIGRVERAGAAMLHLDVTDGHFVPNLTVRPPVVESVRKTTRLDPKPDSKRVFDYVANLQGAVPGWHRLSNGNPKRGLGPGSTGFMSLDLNVDRQRFSAPRCQI